MVQMHGVQMHGRKGIVTRASPKTGTVLVAATPVTRAIPNLEPAPPRTPMPAFLAELIRREEHRETQLRKAGCSTPTRAEREAQAKCAVQPPQPRVELHKRKAPVPQPLPLRIVQLSSGRDPLSPSYPQSARQSHRMREPATERRAVTPRGTSSSPIRLPEAARTAPLLGRERPATSERPTRSALQIDLSQPSRVPFPSTKHVQMLSEFRQAVSTPRVTSVPDARDESARESMTSSPRGCIQDRMLTKRFASRTAGTGRDAATLTLQATGVGHRAQVQVRASTAP
jgi:hypothetical protein